MSNERTSDQVRDRAGEGDRLQEAAGSVAGQAAHTAQAGIGSGLERVGETLDQFASSIRTAGNQMQQQQPQIAGVVDQAAEQVERASQYLRTTNVEAMVHDAENFARRQPVLFIGGALALGWFAGRFLTSSSTRNGQARFEDGSDRSRPGWWYDRGAGSSGRYGSTAGSGSTGGDVSSGSTGGYGSSGGSVSAGYGATGGTGATSSERWSDAEGSNRAGA